MASDENKTQADRDAAVADINPHLIYEVQVLVQQARWLEQLQTSGPATLYTACLEACLLHCRLLIEFLVGRPREGGGRNRNPNDLSAVHLVPDWDEQAPTKVDIADLDLFRQRLDRALAHLSLRRLDKDDRPDSWVLEGVNLVYRSLKVFLLELEALGSSLSVGLRAALDATEDTYPLRPPE